MGMSTMANVVPKLLGEEGCVIHRCMTSHGAVAAIKSCFVVRV